MMTHLYKSQPASPGAQAGIVLFVALIALVVMSLAAVALIRSVDTNTLIAGNLSFRQSTLVTTDTGVEAAITWLKAQSDAGTDMTKDNNANGYYSTYTNLNLVTPADFKQSRIWGADSSATVTGPAGEQIRYIVERMCRIDNSVTVCLEGTSTSSSNVNHNDSPYMEGLKLPGGASPLYRVTVRVTGPKNTVSYAQAYVY
jgi:type IV pilus assembly protein PilX